MIKISPFKMGLLYCIVGLVFVALALNNVNQSGWDFFSVIIVVFATMNIGSGLRFIRVHFRIQKIKNSKK